MFDALSVKLLRLQKWHASLVHVVQRTYVCMIETWYFSPWFACLVGRRRDRRRRLEETSIFHFCTKAARRINRLTVSANGIGSQNVAAFRCWETATWIVRVREMSDGRTVNAVANCFQLSRELSYYPPRDPRDLIKYRETRLPYNAGLDLGQFYGNTLLLPRLVDRLVSQQSRCTNNRVSADLYLPNRGTNAPFSKLANEFSFVPRNLFSNPFPFLACRIKTALSTKGKRMLTLFALFSLDFA